MQAVQQVKSSHPDLEAERGEEESTGLVQDQSGEHSLLLVREGTAGEKMRRQGNILKGGEKNTLKLHHFTHCIQFNKVF